MKKRLILTFCLALLAFNCGGGSPDSDDQILAPISANLKAMEREDIDATMATIDPASTGYAMTREMIIVIFEQYDLAYELSDLKVIKRTAKEAEVSFTQVTRKVTGPDFRNNKIIGVHTLKKTDGAWKIFSSRVKETVYLE
jgi:hypothetical protein